jgi:hypothetical protein
MTDGGTSLTSHRTVSTTSERSSGRSTTTAKTSEPALRIQAIQHPPCECSPSCWRRNTDSARPCHRFTLFTQTCPAVHHGGAFQFFSWSVSAVTYKRDRGLLSVNC